MGTKILGKIRGQNFFLNLPLKSVTAEILPTLSFCGGGGVYAKSFSSLTQLRLCYVRLS